jgi:hypothetical protein
MADCQCLYGVLVQRELEERTVELVGYGLASL